MMARRPKTDQRTAQRAARMVLDCATGLSNTAVAAQRGVTIHAQAGVSAGWPPRPARGQPLHAKQSFARKCVPKRSLGTRRKVSIGVERECDRCC